MLHWLHQSHLQPSGGTTASERAVKSFLRERLVREASQWRVYKTSSPFNRRVTCIEWHPTYHHVAAFAAHSGDVFLWNTDDPERCQMIQGMGYGYGCITSMKFNPRDPNRFYLASVDGTFCLRDFEGRHKEVYLDTMTIELWWCSIDVSVPHNVIFVGNNTGNATLLDLDGRTMATYHRMHRGKIKHAEFCPARSWILATASGDHTACLWDIRMLKVSDTQKPKPLEQLKHEAVVSAVHFDPIYGSRLLTTAQNSELRVYDPHHWSQPAAVIDHPHRHFQHMTDITATWHPQYENLCVVGRYPPRHDPDQTRSVDLLDLETGERLSYLHDPSLKGIVQVNKFNSLGDSLASGMGYSCLLWRAPDKVSLEQAKEKAKRRMDRGGNEDGPSTRKPQKKRKRDSGDNGQLKKTKRVCSSRNKTKAKKL